MQKLNSGALNRILLFVYILSLSTNAIAQNKNNSKETYLLPPHGNYVYGRVIEKLSKEPMVGVTIRLYGHTGRSRYLLVILFLLLIILLVRVIEDLKLCGI